ncbi:MAG TPA: glycosyltransferase [Candidatus Saccharimonas sp.]|nr:glycosyltransferase [Candidatus Saccharimonas sp.]
MKIATMVRGYLPMPRPKDILYAPLDLAAAIAEGLAARGHAIDFYAPKGSKLNGVTIKDMGMRPLVTNADEWTEHLGATKRHVHYRPWLWDNIFVEEMFKRAAAGDYDALLFHHPELAMPYARRYPQVKIASVMHDPLFDWFAETAAMYKAPNSQLISISDNQRAGRTDLPWGATIYNGIDTNIFTPGGGGDYLLYSGRIIPEKNVADAVQLAIKTDQKLVIAGLLFHVDEPYFNQHVKPFLNDKIKYVGYVPREELTRYYQNAKALLMPVQWDEPFGMNMAEAMACGTPVLGYKRGAIPEVVQDGVTGFVVDNFDDLVAAAGNIHTLSRAACRQRAEQLFSVERMVSGYETYLQKRISQPFN